MSVTSFCRRCAICGPILNTDHYTSKQHQENCKLHTQGKSVLTYEQSCKKFHMKPSTVVRKVLDQEVAEKVKAVKDQTPRTDRNYEKNIQDQQTDGIGGSRHQHGMPGGRYAHRGACSAVRFKSKRKN